MSITHIPPNEWAAVGARLERCDGVMLFKNAHFGYAATVKREGNSRVPSGFGKTSLEALTAALDAAEGVK